MNLSSQHLGTVYSFDCQFEALPDIWVSLDVTIEAALECIKTGLLHNKPVTRVKLFSISSDGDSVSFVYDIVQSKTGGFPWSLTAQ